MRVGLGETGATALRLALPACDAKPFAIDEAKTAAFLLAKDWRIECVPLHAVMVGIILDLRPNDLTPARGELAKALNISRPMLDRAEIVWEMLREDIRLDMVRRAVRIVLAMRRS